MDPVGGARAGSAPAGSANGLDHGAPTLPEMMYFLDFESMQVYFIFISLLNYKIFLLF